MHKKIVLFVACLLFGGLQILASGGGGRKEPDYSNLMKEWRLTGPSADAMKAILNSSSADDVQSALDTLKKNTTADLKNVFAQLLLALTDREVSTIETSTQADEEIETFKVELQRAAIEKILEYGANPINDPIDTVLFSENKLCHHTLLYRAIQNKVDPSIIEYLLKKGAVIDEQSGTGIKKCETCTCRQCPTPTHLAVHFGCTDILPVLNPQDCLVQDCAGNTPLHLEFKKIPNAWWNKYDFARAQILLARMIAATEDKTREAQVLLSRQNNDGKSLLHGAIQRISNEKTLELPKRLLVTGVERHQLDKDGNSPLMLLVNKNLKYGHGDHLFKTLLQNAPLEALGSQDKLILFQPFVRDNLVRFAQVIQRIKDVKGNSSAESATWMKQQKKDKCTVLQDLVFFDQGSHMINRFFGSGQDFSPQVQCLFEQGLVHPDDHEEALDLAKKYSNKKMKKILSEGGKSLMGEHQVAWAKSQQAIAAAEEARVAQAAVEDRLKQAAADRRRIAEAVEAAAADRARIAEEAQAAADAANAERARLEQDAAEEARAADRARIVEEALVAQAAADAADREVELKRIADLERKVAEAAADQRRLAEAIEAVNAERARLEQAAASAQKSKLAGRFAIVVVTAAIATALTALAVAKNPQAFYRFGKTALSRLNASVKAFATSVAARVAAGNKIAVKAAS